MGVEDGDVLGDAPGERLGPVGQRPRLVLALEEALRRREKRTFAPAMTSPPTKISVPMTLTCGGTPVRLAL
ncbi:hypothetical protein ACFV6E_38260 [Streptomyces sp. NPDC059785]|uniref:hypothetical protein n=1 Tax=Streptomyces sp. NPDC059785 TaxID=3346945 RepID=UPI00365C9F70